MSTATVKEALPVNVMVLLDGQELTVALTDCRVISRQAKAPCEVGLLLRLSAAAAGGEDPAAAVDLFDRLLPGDVGDFLRRSPYRLLHLQLPAELDAIAWECAHDGAQALGARFSVIRHLVADPAGDDASPSAEELSPDPAGAALVWTVLHLGATGMPRFSFVPADVDGVLVRHMSVGTSLTHDEWRKLAHSHVVQIAGGAPAAALAALGVDTWPLRARLVVLEAGAACDDATLRWLQKVGASAAAVVCLDGGALGADGLDELCAGLLAGRRIADALRRVRGRNGHVPAWSAARLYGPGDALLCEPRREHDTDHDTRPVTSLSFDVVGSTRLLDELGSERYAELLSALHAKCIAIVREHGGVAGDPQGNDGLMCFFGYPVAREDAAELAVAAGLEITAAELGMSVRVGITTGMVAVRAGQPFGPSIHRAARLQKLALPGTVKVSGTTYGKVRHRFMSKEPLDWADQHGERGDKALCTIAADLNERRRHRLQAQGQLSPFVGRQAELDTLWSTWDVARRGHCKVLLITGEAGIGKSRLVHEFRESLLMQGQESLECRCWQDARVSAFHALTETLRRHLGLYRRDDDAARLAKIVNGLPEGMDAEHAVPLIANFLSVPLQKPYVAPKGAPERVRQLTLSVMVEWFRCAARKRPICLVVEDLHWIDPSTQEFLGLLMAQADALPIMVMLTLRSDADTGWRPASPYETLELRGLAPELARRLVAQTGAGSLPASVVRLLTARADGVPLFLEESARMALELGAGPGGGQSLPELGVPTTLQDLLMARLDRIGAAARTVAQVGAVIGREFSHHLLEQVMAQRAQREGDLAALAELLEHLQTLETSGLLWRSGEGADKRYGFRHALVRDTAYESLWEIDRQRMHLLVATVIREHCPELAEEQPELLARHQAEAGLLQEALVQWEEAARRAAGRSAHDESISHVKSALVLLQRMDGSPERDATELRLQLLLASRFIATEGYGAEQVERAYARAAQLCDALGDAAARLKVELGLAGYHFMRGSFQQAHDNAQRAAQMARHSPDPMSRLQARWSDAIIRFHQGDAVAAVERMDACLAEYRPDMHRRAAVQDPGVMCLCYSAWGQWELGYVDDALARISRVLQLAEALGHKFSLGEAYAFAASVHHFRGETDEALVWAERCVSLCEEAGFSVWLAHGRVMRGRLLCERQQLREGLREMREGYELWVRTGAVVTRPVYLELQAEGLAIMGRPEEGLALLDQALQIAQKYGERYHEAEVRRLIAELNLQKAVLAGQDASAEAEHWLLSAHDLARQQHKRSFALRSATGLAQLWSQQGRHDEAVALLRPVFEGFDEGQHTRDLNKARALLAQLGAVPAIRRVR